jgi:hypothetical protein
VVECGGLENRFGPFRSDEGSNPSPSACRAEDQGLVIVTDSPWALHGLLTAWLLASPEYFARQR